MKPFLKITVWIIGLIVVLVLAAAIILPLLVDPNDYREEIENAAREQTGRELKLEGDMNLSVIPWLGVEIGRASLSNAPGMGDEPMVAIEGASVGVKLMPLLGRRLVVSQITLDGARINLYQGPDGTNWDDLTGGEAAPEEAALAEEGAGFDISEIGGISLRDARVKFVDDVNKAALDAGLGGFSTGRITGSGAVFEIDGIEVSEASVDYSDPDVGKLSARLGSLSTGDVVADPDQPAVADLRLANAVVELGGGKSGALNARIESLVLAAVKGSAEAPQLEGLELQAASIDYDDAKGMVLKAEVPTLSAARIDGNAEKPVLEQVVLESASIDYRGGPEGTVKGTIDKFTVTRLVGDAEAPLLDKLLVQAVDLDYDGGEAGRYAVKADRLEADKLAAGPGAPVVGKTIASKIRVVQPGEGGFEFEVEELSTGGAVADPEALQVEGVTLKKARFSMDQGEAGRAEARIDEFSLGVLKPGTETPVKGRIEGSYGAPVVNFTTTLDGRARMDKDGTLALSGFSADLGLEGAEIPGGKQTGRVAASSLSVNTKTQVMALDGLTADLAGMSLKASATGNKIMDAPDIRGTLDTGEFSPRKLMETLGLEAPVTADPAVLNKASVTGSFRVAEDRAALSGLKAVLDDTRMNGDFSATGGEPAVLRASLKVDQIDVDRYLPPEGQEAETPTEEGVGEIDASDLRKVDAEASLDIGKLKVSGITMTSVQAKAVVKDGKLTVDPLGAALYGGKVAGLLALDGSSDVPKLTFRQSLNSVQVGSLLGDMADVDRLTGKAAMSLNLNTAGTTSKDMISALDGDIDFELADGMIRGFNITHALQSAVALFERKAPPKATSNDTVFEDFRGSAKVEKGVVRSDDLNASLPNLQVTGAGMVDLGSQNMDYRLDATVPKGQAATDAGLGKLAGKSVPVKITGSLDDPSVSADVSAIIASQVESFILDKLGGGKKKDEAAESAGEGSTEETQSEPNEEEPQSLEDSLKEQALKKLFGN
ncbi:MAG: AsmA family protein [Gammaproteobacteria bacterium]|nr:MAG: AsmA family protein [Gammaproteobacteria bacterium]